jgi:hypothetical protein
LRSAPKDLTAEHAKYAETLSQKHGHKIQDRTVRRKFPRLSRVPQLKSQQVFSSVTFVSLFAIFESDEANMMADEPETLL